MKLQRSFKWILLLVVVLWILPFVDQRVQSIVIILLGIYILWYWRMWYAIGVSLIISGTGILLNAIVIYANNGKMPAAGSLNNNPKYTAIDANTQLVYLSDIIGPLSLQVTLGSFHFSVIGYGSLGDIFIVVGYVSLAIIVYRFRDELVELFKKN